MEGNKANLYYRILWIIWIIFLILVSYKVRFWINNDTIGSLDVAIYFKKYELLKSINSYWGSMYGFFLSFLPLGNLNSWFIIHLMILIMVLSSQYFLYLSLRKYNVSKFIATIIILNWGIFNFATGGAFFITADVPLVFLASSYILVASRLKVDEINSKPLIPLSLGVLHSLMAITKAVAFYGLLIYPFLVIINTLRKNEPMKYFKATYFCFMYFVLFTIIMLVWSTGIYYKYGRFTYADTPSWNYALFVDKSIGRDHAREEAVRSIPDLGTYWRSDIGSIKGWDFHYNINIKKQFYRIYRNLYDFIKSTNFTDISIKITMILAFFGLIHFSFKTTKYNENVIILGITGFFIFLIYSQVSLQIRFFPFTLIFLMPIMGLYIENNFKIKNIKNMILIFIILSNFYGLVVMAFASVTAPNAAHFNIVKAIENRLERKNNIGYIGAYFTHDYIDHHGVIAFLLQTKAARIDPVNSNLSKFTASFEPKIIILGIEPGYSIVNELTVNNHKYREIYRTLWKLREKEEELIIYEKINFS